MDISAATRREMFGAGETGDFNIIVVEDEVVGAYNSRDAAFEIVVEATARRSGRRIFDLSEGRHLAFGVAKKK
jgi:hypothetical protein